MKKTILILVVLALLVPASALAATEFSLGGFIKLSTFWDSTQNGYTPTGVIQRNNDQLFHHGQFNMSAQESRFSFTIKGPKFWGATTTGFIEMDFDGLADNNFSSVSGAVGNVAVTSPYLPRLRHAMFRLNWPETELMLGQYWGMFSEYSPEATGDSQMTNHGFLNQRVAQIRLTQKFLGDWTVAGAIMKPYDPSAADANWETVTAAGVNNIPAPGVAAGPAAAFNQLNGGAEGRSSETPQLQGKIQYEKDLYGKAAFYGRPRGFTAQVTGGWQRTRYRANQFTVANIFTFGQNQFGQAGNGVAGGLVQNAQQYLDPWCIQGTLFIPVLPTYSANLAGTASLTAQYWIGQGVSFVGGNRDNDNSWFDFSGIGRVNNGAGAQVNGTFYNRKLMNQFGGYLQGQYWFTNQWFMNAAFGMIRNYGIDQGTSALLAGQALNPAGYKYASNNDQQKLNNEFDLTLWYRPIEAIKFGLQYSYSRSIYLQKIDNPQIVGAVPGPGGLPAQAQGQPAAGAKDVGESHRVQFVAQMFF